MDKLLFLIFIFGVLLPSLCNVSSWGQPCWDGVELRTETMRTVGMGTSSCPHAACNTCTMCTRNRDSYRYRHIHGCPRKIRGYGYVYKCEISYPRQAWLNITYFVRSVLVVFNWHCFCTEIFYHSHRPVAFVDGNYFIPFSHSYGAVACSSWKPISITDRMSGMNLQMIK